MKVCAHDRLGDHVAICAYDLFQHRSGTCAYNTYDTSSTRLLPYILRTPKPIIYGGQASQTFKDINLDLWGNWRRRNGAETCVNGIIGPCDSNQRGMLRRVPVVALGSLIYQLPLHALGINVNLDELRAGKGEFKSC